MQLLIVVLGLALLFEPDVLTDPAPIAGTPDAEDVLFAFTIAIAAFSGLDASSSLAGEVAVSRRGLKRLFAVRTAAAVPYLGIALVASSTLPQTGDRWYEAPMLGIASAFDQEWLREPLRYVIAVSALAILVIACNAAMFGLSRLGYSLALNRQIPSLARAAAPALQHAGRADRARRAARDRARAADRPRAARRDLRVRRDARVHARPPLGDPAALPRARPRPARTRSRSTSGSGAASCR